MLPSLPDRSSGTIIRYVTSQVAPESHSLNAGDPHANLVESTILLAACGNDADGLVILGQLFRSHVPRLVAEVDDALRARRGPQLLRAAHKLCGILAAFSPAASAVASTIEEHASRGRMDEARPLAQRLAVMVREIHLQVDGLSLESLRRQRGPGAHPLESAG